MKYELGIPNPNELSDEEWAQAYWDFQFLDERKAQIMENAFRKVMGEVLKSFSVK